MMAEIHQHKHQTIQGYCKKQKPDLVSVLKPSIKDSVAEPEGKSHTDEQTAQVHDQYQDTLKSFLIFVHNTLSQILSYLL